MDAQTLLKNEEDKALLMDMLQRHMERHGFDRRIDEFVDGIVDGRLSDVADIDEIFDKLYEFVISNLPVEIQEAFYYDVRSFIDRGAGRSE